MQNTEGGNGQGRTVRAHRTAEGELQKGGTARSEHGQQEEGDVEQFLPGRQAVRTRAQKVMTMISTVSPRAR